MMRQFPQKDPGESVILGFDFTKDLPTGVTLTGTPVFVIAPSPGMVDPNVGSMLIGSPQLIGNVAVQMCVAGISLNTYSVQASCNASNGEVFIQGASLPIVPAWQQ